MVLFLKFMTDKRRYLIVQLLAIPLYALPAIIGGFLLGSLIESNLGVDSWLIRNLITLGCVILAGFLLGRVTGKILEALGMLPEGAYRFYPQARSWSDYELRAQSSGR